MGEVEGPYKYGSINSPSDVTIITRATRSDPAVIECIFTLHDSNKNRYNYYNLYIDIVDPTLVGRPPIRRMITTMHFDDIEKHDFFTERQSATMCSQDSNKTCVAYRVFVGPKTPTLIAKCILKYSPPGPADTYTCSSLSTMAIIANYFNSTSELPCSTIQPTSTNPSIQQTASLSQKMATTCSVSIKPTPTSTSVGVSMSTSFYQTSATPISSSEPEVNSPLRNYLPPRTYGPTIAILGVIVVIETAIITAYIITKLYHKFCSQKEETEVVVIKHKRAISESADPA